MTRPTFEETVARLLPLTTSDLSFDLKCKIVVFAVSALRFWVESRTKIWGAEFVKQDCW